MTAFVLRNIRVGFFCLFFVWIQPIFTFAQTAGSGLNFDGVDDFVKVASPFNNYGKELTLECWVNITYATRGSGIGQGLEGVDSYVWLLHAIPAGNGFRFYVNLFPNAQVSLDIVIGSGWHHIACTVGSTSLKFYVDGVLVDNKSITNNGIRNNTSSVVVLGRDVRFLTGRFYNGAMDEVRIWNRELCQSEIQYNMNKEIDPTQQTGLKYYFNFNQGIENGTNSTTTTLTDYSGNGYHGTLNNFGLTGTTSNWTTGTTLTQSSRTFSPSSLAGTAGGGQVCRTTDVLSPGLNYNDASCQLLSRVAPSGATPVSGSVTTCVTVDATVQSYNGEPYVQRHYDITPSTDPSTSTGTVTLYFTQTEFDDFNLARGSAPALPVSSSDITGISNIRVTKYGGTGTAPGNYTGSATILNPEDADIIWDPANLRWAVTVSVTGFSGFYLTTSTNTLPVQLLSFQGQQLNGFNRLRWKVAMASASRFFVQRSANGKDFVSISEIDATASDGQYSFMDSIRWFDQLYYRLQMEDNQGVVTYSNLLKLGGATVSEFSIYPNPTQSHFMVQIPAAHIGQTGYLVDGSGRRIHSVLFSSIIQQINVDNLPRGLYNLWIGNEFKRLMLR